MSNNNSDNFGEAIGGTVVAGVTFLAGAAFDEVVKAHTGKSSNGGKLAASSFLAAIHLNEAKDILDGWMKG